MPIGPRGRGGGVSLRVYQSRDDQQAALLHAMTPDPIRLLKSTATIAMQSFACWWCVDMCMYVFMCRLLYIYMVYAYVLSIGI